MARTAKMKTTDNSAPEATEASPTSPGASARAPRQGSKLATVVGLLESEAGATIAEIITATGWQQHTVRGALAGAITKKFARALTSDKVEGRGRVYRAPQPRV